MVEIPNPVVIFAKRFGGEGLPIPGEHLRVDRSRTIDVDNVPLNGGFLTQTLILSPEPYLLERMRSLGPEVSSYVTHYLLNDPILGFAVVRVLRSEKEGVEPGMYMYGHTPWQEYVVQPYQEGRHKDYNGQDWSAGTMDIDDLESFQLRPVPDPKGAYPLTSYISVLGTPGLTAYMGLEGLLDVRKADAIYISSGASGVGSIAIQLAKLKGLTVIASASTDERVEYMRSLGADYPFNYKKEGYRTALREVPPFQIFWDNVGGEVLEIGLEFIAPYGQVLCCGGSSEYTIPLNKRHGVQNTANIFRKRLSLRGFLVPDPDLAEYIDKFIQDMPPLLSQGKIQGKEHIFEGGWDSVPQALVDTLTGNFDGVGKPVIVVQQ